MTTETVMVSYGLENTLVLNDKGLFSTPAEWCYEYGTVDYTSPSDRDVKLGAHI